MTLWPRRGSLGCAHAQQGFPPLFRVSRTFFRYFFQFYYFFYFFILFSYFFIFNSLIFFLLFFFFFFYFFPPYFFLRTFFPRTIFPYFFSRAFFPRFFSPYYFSVLFSKVATFEIQRFIISVSCFSSTCRYSTVHVPCGISIQTSPVGLPLEGWGARMGDLKRPTMNLFNSKEDWSDL